MRKKRTGTGILVMLFLLTALSGCAAVREEEKPSRLRVGISVYNQYDTFIDEMTTAIEEYVSVMENKYAVAITLDIQSAGGSQSVQNDQVDTFIRKQYDVICVNLVDRTDPSSIIEHARNADIPIIFYNRELVEEDLLRWDKLYYVGADAFESGILQGEILIERLKSDWESVDRNGDGVIQYVMLEGEAGHQDSIVRTMYSVDTVTGAGYDVEKLGDGIANWNRDQARTRMKQWIGEYKDSIEVVFSNNDDMAMGAVDALMEAGYYEEGDRRPPVVLGVDGTVHAKEMVDEGYILGTVINDAVGQARALLELAYALKAGTDLPQEYRLEQGRYIRLPYKIYEREGAEESTAE